MKKSRIAKLALMGASITALAATLTTSTYAWYVSNRQADVTGGYGATGSADSDGSILVSWNNTTKKFSRSIAFTDTNVKSNYKAARLQPVHWAAAENTDAAGFYSLGVDTSNHKTIKGSAAGDNDVLTFEVVLKSNQAVNQRTVVTPSIKITGYGAGSVASGTAVTPADQQVLVGNYSTEDEATIESIEKKINDYKPEFGIMRNTKNDIKEAAVGLSVIAKILP